MQHRRKTRRFDRSSSHREAMFRNMVTSLLKHEKIETTHTKAKELKTWAEKMITLAKRGDLHARRQALAVIREKNAVKKLFEEIAPRYEQRNGGYLRLTKTSARPGDGAQMAMVELLPEEKPAPEQTPKKKTKKKAAKKKEA